MNPLTRQDVLAHQPIVPWPSQCQVEQDLLLSRAMAAVFSDGFLREQVAMRGGTLLRQGIAYDPAAAGNYVRSVLLDRLPE